MIHFSSRLSNLTNHLLGMLALALAFPAFAQFSPPVEIVTPRGGRYQEIVVSVRVPHTACFLGCPEKETVLHGILWMPLGGGIKPPYKLAVYNHGSQDGGIHFSIREPSGLVAVLLKHGYAVMRPIRKGFSANEFPRSVASADSYERISCNADLRPGVASAVSDVKAYLKALASRDDLNMNDILLTGASRGGVISLALAAEGYPGVVGVVNMSGGWMSEYDGDGRPCGVSANESFFRQFGESIKVPVLSLYGGQDTYYGVTHIKTLLAYLGKNSPADYLIMEDAGHGVRISDKMRPAWDEKWDWFTKLVKPTR